MSKTQNPLTLARAIVSAHRRWIALPNGEALGTAMTRVLAREGRRNVAEAAQVIRSALGRVSAVEAIKTDSFSHDCGNARHAEEGALFRKAITILEPAKATVDIEEVLKWHPSQIPHALAAGRITADVAEQAMSA